MILTFFKGLLRELWLLVKDPRGIFMFLVAPLLMNIVVCGAFQNGIVNHIPLAAVEMSSSAKTRELIRAFDESDRFDVTLVLQDSIISSSSPRWQVPSRMKRRKASFRANSVNGMQSSIISIKCFSTALQAFSISC